MLAFYLELTILSVSGAQPGIGLLSRKEGKVEVGPAIGINAKTGSTESRPRHAGDYKAEHVTWRAHTSATGRKQRVRPKEQLRVRQMVEVVKVVDFHLVTIPRGASSDQAT